MNNSKSLIGTFLVFLFFTFTNSLIAQYIIEQVEQEIPINYELIPEDAEFDSQEDENNFFINIPENRLKEAAIKEGMEIREEKATIYIDNNNFAVETYSDDMGKITMVFNAGTGVMSTIMWEQQKVIEMSSEDMADMEEKSKVMTERMMENIPSEYREQVLAEMENEKNKPQVSYIVHKTGKNKKLYGFDCEEYRVDTDEKMIIIWASTDKIGITKEVERFSESFDELFNTRDEEGFNEWELISGKIPIQVRTLSSSMMMGEPLMVIQTITKIDKKKPSANKFKIPGENEGFTKGSMMDLMRTMPDFE
jgi:hypothetical protein